MLSNSITIDCIFLISTRLFDESPGHTGGFCRILVLDADTAPAFAEVGPFVDERRPVDELHRRERCIRVTGCHPGANGVPVDPTDRQDGHSSTVALRERRLGRQRNVATDVGGSSVARLETEA